MKNLYKLALLIMLATFFVSPFLGMAQKIELSDGNTGFSISQADDQSIHFQNQLSSFSTFDVNTHAGNFTQPIVQGYSGSNEEGAPMVPVLKKLMEVPYGADYEIKFSNIIVKTIRLRDFGIETLIFPAQPPVSKSDDVDNLPFIFDESIYKTDDWYGDKLVKVVDLGVLRGVKLARLEIAPFMYNPVSGELNITLSFDCEIGFTGARTSQTEAEKTRVYSPWFEAAFNQLINHQKPEPPSASGRELLDVTPLTYIIVSDPMFQDALQTFIQWKTKKGYKVVEAYTNNPSVGTTTTSIKGYLKNFYLNPPEGYHPQTFVLFVGDVAQIPAFSGTTGSHVTDLYYCEYTNDFLPDCYYGRFSANNLSQLQPQLDKTLEYEQYAFPDPTFLDEVVMVAGADASHQLTWGNGQINYGNLYYFNAAHGLYSHTYLQPEPSGGNYSSNIRQNVSDGVGYANYSAHCSASGWADPSFVISHISALTNFHQYPLMVGNCCSSVEFQNTCFGEEILRAPLKGAVGYIGGSNSTYWDEDFWWGVGLEAIAANPTYNSNHLGAYDRTFHDRTGITTDDWYITQGQMVSSGNLAVSQSGSSREKYYWEIYHLMGDPSLMIYFSQPPDISASYAPLMLLGAEEFTVNTEPYAYVAISMDGILHGAAMADGSGVALVNILPVSEPGEADVVITGQNLKPFIGTVLVSTPTGPHVVLQSFQIDDATGNGNGLADYGETLRLDVSLENLGNDPGNNINLTLSSANEFVNILQPTAVLGNIAAGAIVSLTDIFEMSIAENVPDGESLNFILVATDGTANWQSAFSFTGHAPVLEFTDYSVNDPLGNNNGKLDPGEVAEIIVEVKNTGSAGAIAVTGLLSTLNQYINMLTTEPQLFGNLSPNASAIVGFEISCNSGTPAGQNISFTLNIAAGFGIVASADFSLMVGQTPVLVVDLDGNTNSASQIVNAINTLGVTADYATTLPSEPELYASVFVCLGIYNSNHVLSATEGQTLKDYLNAGGRLYMEGGDTWAYDSQTAVHGMFGINGTSDGSADLGTVVGVSGTLTEGMTYSYTGDNSWIDHLSAIDNGKMIFNNQSPAYGCAVSNEQSVYKTIGASFEFGGLSGDRTILMKQYLIFFEILQPVVANFTADLTEISAGESVNFTNLSSGNPDAFSWSFPGGTPSSSNIETPTITYNSPGLFSVSLTASVGGDVSTETKTEFITVNALPITQSILIQAGWNGVSSCLIPENTNLFSLLGPYLEELVIMQDMKGVFYPDYSINTIGDWDYQTGYKIKAALPFTLELTGLEPSNSQLILKQGWNLLPVLSSEPVDIGDLLAPVMDKVSVVKSVPGNGVFWPNFNINTIGNLQPGACYFILMTEEATISF